MHLHTANYTLGSPVKDHSRTIVTRSPLTLAFLCSKLLCGWISTTDLPAKGTLTCLLSSLMHLQLHQLYNKHPHKRLSYTHPYMPIQANFCIELIGPLTFVTVSFWGNPKKPSLCLDLGSVTFAMPVVGFEPTTRPFRDRSTTELHSSSIHFRLMRV